MPLAKGQVLNERYRIVSLLGEGGFGAVYRAWDTRLNGPCALKENFSTTPEAERQFAQEATILFNLRHPGLPMVFDYFSVSGQGQYLVMVFVEGQDLQAVLDASSDPLTESKILPWIAQICDALSYLHAQEPPIIHRDVKPANIKITPQGQAVLVDFGISKVYDPKLKTTIGARAVTPGFSPPEQYGRGRTDPRTDIYALGATFYALLTGIEPPDSVDLLAGNEPPPPPPNALNPEISPGVNAVVTKSMQLDRGKRFQTALEFKTALSEISDPLQGTEVAPVSHSAAKITTLLKPRVMVKAEPQPPRPQRTGGMVKQKGWLIATFTFLTLLVLAVVLYQIPPIQEQVNNLFWNPQDLISDPSEGEMPLEEPIEIHRSDVPLENNPSMGSWDSPVTIAMFGDYADDQSRVWNFEYWPRLQEAFGPQIRLVYLDFPQERVHPQSFAAALAANCAQEQNRFWEYYDRLYTHHLGLGTDAYYGYAEELGFEMELFRECLETERYHEDIFRDVEAAQVLDLKRAPVFFINGIRVNGLEPFEVFVSIIERELGGRP